MFTKPQTRLWPLTAVLCLAACSGAPSGGAPDAAITADRVAADDLSSALDSVSIDVPTMDVSRFDAGFDASAVADATIVDGVHDVLVPFAFPVDPGAVPPPGSECASADAGTRLGDPSIDPPRPVSPQSVSRVTSQRPTFRWILPAGTTGAHVEACADRCCTRVLGSYDAEGSSVRPERAFPPGMVYWRMFGRRGGSVGTRASATWEFEVRRRDTPVDSSWGTIRDFNGDGYDDLVELVSVGTPEGGTTHISFVAGGPTGPAVARDMGETIAEPSRWSEIGDFNGDGRADLSYATRRASVLAGPIEVLQGASDGIHHALTIDSSALVTCATIQRPAVTDWNGDGYSDLVGGVNFGCGATTSSVTGSELAVWFGSVSGLAAVPQVVGLLPGCDELPYQVTNRGMGDLDGDGFGDVVLGCERIDEESIAILAGGSSDGRVHAREIRLPDSSYLQGMTAYPIGDYDGDGILDHAAKAFMGDRISVYHGSLGTYFGVTPVAVLEDEIFNASRWMLDSSIGARSGFGQSIATGDLDGDGYADLMVSSPASFSRALDPLTPFNTGRMFVYRGSIGGLMTNPFWIDRTIPTDGSNLRAFASVVTAPGDLNGDGIDDAAVLDGGRRAVCYLMGDVGMPTADAIRCESVGSDPRTTVYLP